MKINIPQLNQRGQTIIELLIATAVIGSVVTGVAIALTYNIKNNAEVQYREAATTYSHQAIERLRREREAGGWAALNNALADNQTYCLNDLDNLPASGPCGDDTFAHARIDFKRELTVEKNDAGDTIDLYVTVSWHANTSDETSVTTHHRMKDRLN